MRDNPFNNQLSHDQAAWQFKLQLTNYSSVASMRRFGARLRAAASTFFGDTAVHATANRLRIVNIDDASTRNLELPIDHSPATIAVSFTGSTIASGGLDGSVCAWRNFDKTPHPLFRLDSTTSAIGVSPSGIVAAGSSSGEIVVIKPGTLEPTRVLQIEDEPTSIIFPLDRQFTIGTSSGRIISIDVASREISLSAQVHTGAIKSLALTTSLQSFATSGDDGLLIFATKSATDEMQVLDSVAAHSPLGAFANLDGTSLWAIASGTRIALWNMNAHEWVGEEDLGSEILDLRCTVSMQFLATTADGASRLLRPVVWWEKSVA